MQNCKLGIANWEFPKGIALIELLVGFGIIGIISFVIAGVFLAHYKLYNTQTASVDVASQNKLGIDEMTNQIRQAQSIVTTCSACGTDQTGASILVLRLWPLDSSGNPMDPTSANYDYIVYKQDPSNSAMLLKITYPDSTSSRKAQTQRVANNISSLVFTYDNSDVTQASEVDITLTTAQTVAQKTLTTTADSKAILRNK